MSIEELVEAHLAGEKPEVPPELADEFARALAAHEALRFAAGETLLHGPALPGDYRIIRELGRGGMGVVYLARQESLDREVAIKVLRPNQEFFAPVLKRFREEARHLARLRHPNIVSIHEVGEVDGEPYFTMEFVDGESLSAVLKRGAMNPSQALETLKQVAAAVDHAHKQGIIHRDLKPANILVDRAGQNYVTDFGLARNITQTSVLTQSGDMLGTPAYMAPEQARGDLGSVSEATDVHAMGVILYECLTGQTPYGKDAPALVLVRLMREDPEPPRRINRQIPRDLETVCMKAMAKSPAKRYATAAAFCEDLVRFESGEAVLARRQSPLERWGRKAMRHWKLALASSAAVVLLAMLLFNEAARGPSRSLLDLAIEYEESYESDAILPAYRKALEEADDAQRDEILERLVALASRHPSAGIPAPPSPVDPVEAALLALTIDPAVDFKGSQADWLVAEKLLSRLRAAQGIASSGDRETLELARTRLNILLGQTELSRVRREEAEQDLGHVVEALEGGSGGLRPTRPFRPSPGFLQSSPSDPLAELLARSGDPTLSNWERARAAYAAGLALEKAGERDKALASFRDSFDLHRRLCPIVDGITMGLSSTYAQADGHPSRVGEELRSAVDAIARLGGEPVPSLQGGLRFRIEGFSIPPEGFYPGLQITLYDPMLSEVGMPESYSRDMMTQFHPDGTVTIRAAEGRYALRVSDGHFAHDGEHAELARLLTLDTSGIPEIVEIRGEVLELEPLRASLLAPITLLTPEDGASVDLNEVIFRWSPVEGADRYRVGFSRLDEGSSGIRTITYFASVEVSDAVLVPGALSRERLERVRLYAAGDTGRWSVTALKRNQGADGEEEVVLGKTVTTRTFLVVQALSR